MAAGLIVTLVVRENQLSKNFADIFAETHKTPKQDSEGYVTIDLETVNEAQALAVYVVMNEGALRERDRIIEAFKQIDANWVTFALKELEKIPRNLPRNE
jgi:hypothetical protein